MLDVGCHSASLLVVERRPSTPLRPVFTHKVRLRLHERVDASGRIRPPGVREVRRGVAEALRAAREVAPPGLFPFATSVIRDAPNGDEVVSVVARETGTHLRFLDGEEEARLAYVAARRWFDSPAGGMLLLDIGGGTVEIAAGGGSYGCRPGGAVGPAIALSLPLGARRITLDWFREGPVTARRVAAVREHLAQTLTAVPSLPRADGTALPVGCSKALQQLARLTANGRPALRGDGSARPGRRRGGDRRPRKPRAGGKGAGGAERLLREGCGRAADGADRLRLEELRHWIPVLAATPAHRRAELPGISRHRAEQSLAAALVAEALMTACGVDELRVSPWSTAQGLLLELLDAAEAGAAAGVDADYRMAG
ncbi:Ppx/GppA phosphatase family protein [Allostreptomyces psammosilenae]|uniref:Exopolyphosphatase/guanosine-5'-triphosphate, 3'-diphosphate pyrophosphatase n=1 Tax=Allostreptomyces psammosilenae TaxID=1892865 RepID=A0A852ZUT9_9ACTN|nr:hypothetical protein [Allostreptomyces psammosilenae]NYI05040.1 exopolyphosphatase/guanosine-5'-triphosphate,3'-diphosphate pyrophosphatase [Allostreptomyces psammosilenae]